MDFSSWMISHAVSKVPGNLRLEAGYLLRRMGEPEPGESMSRMHRWIDRNVSNVYERQAEHDRLNRLYESYRKHLKSTEIPGVAQAVSAHAGAKASQGEYPHRGLQVAKPCPHFPGEEGISGV